MTSYIDNILKSFDIIKIIFFQFVFRGFSGRYPAHSMQGYIQGIQGTVRLMLSVHPCTNENARFTTVPLKTVFDQLRIRYYVYSLEI